MFLEITSVFIEFIYRILKRLKIRIDGTKIYISLEEEKFKESIDERIAKIDLARANLIEGLNAIDELRETAERNRQEVEIALTQIAQLEKDKTILQKQLEGIKTIAQSDIEAFRKVTGVLTPAEIRKERLLGFISGVIASMTASGLIWAIIKLIQYLQ